MFQEEVFYMLQMGQNSMHRQLHETVLCEGLIILHFLRKTEPE
jgi:hypothetical protein